MKKFCLTILLIGFSFIGRAQITTHWELPLPSTYHVGYGLLPSTNTVLDSSSNYYCNLLSQGSTYLRKIDSSGVIQWTVQFDPDVLNPGGNFIASGIKLTPDQKILITSLYTNGSIVRRIDPNGNTDFKYFYPDLDIWHLIQSTSGFVYFLGLDSASAIKVRLLDNTGTLIRTDSIYSGPSGLNDDGALEDNNGYVYLEYQSSDSVYYLKYYNDSLYQIIPTAKYSQIFFDHQGNIYRTENSTNLWRIFKYDNNWNLQWQLNPGGNTVSTDFDNAGNLFHISRNSIYNFYNVKKISPTGNILWTYWLSPSGNRNYSNYILKIDSRNNVNIQGEKLDFPGQLYSDANTIFLTQLDNDGHLLGYFEKNYTGGTAFALGTRMNEEGQSFFNVISSSGVIHTCVNLYAHPNIYGQIFYDTDSDCNFDSTEIGLPQINVSCNPGNQFYTSSSDGKFFFEVPDGNYMIDYVLPPNFSVTCGPGPIPVTVTNGVMSGNTTIGVVGISGANDLSIDFTHTNARQNRDIFFNIHYQNQGTTVLNGTVHFDFDTIFSYVSSSLAADTILPNSMAWNFTNLIPGESRYISLVLHCGMSPIGTDYTSTATISSIAGETHPENNSVTETDEVTGSMDSNEKYVLPKGNGTDGLISYTDSTLNFKIVFQNTGIDTAFYIQVIDTLDADLDPLSFQLKTIYPQGTCSLSGNGILRFSFDPAYLPNSSRDEANSYGFISYSIKLRPGLPMGTRIENKADIYFDYYPFVTTDTTLNTINQVVSVPDFKSDDIFSCYPNPAADKLYIEFREPSFGKMNLITLYSLSGKQIFQSFTDKIRNEIDVNGLISGMYLLRVECKNYTKTVKVVVTKRKTID